MDELYSNLKEVVQLCLEELNIREAFVIFVSRPLIEHAFCEGLKLPVKILYRYPVYASFI